MHALLMPQSAYRPSLPLTQDKNLFSFTHATLL